jgi:hypothetical protein
VLLLPVIPAGSMSAIGECASRSLFEYLSTHENADADEQEQHDDEEQGHCVVLRRRGAERRHRALVKKRGRPERKAAPIASGGKVLGAR